MDWKEEFYQKFTDGADKENDYYDAMFTVSKPCEVEYFIEQLLNNKQNMTEQNETVFGEGFIFKRPHENAPAFVKGSMSVKVSEAIAFLQKHQEKDWVNLDLLASKDNSKLYFKLNTWKPEQPQEAQNAPAQPATQQSPNALPAYPLEQSVDPADIPWWSNLKVINTDRLSAVFVYLCITSLPPPILC